MLNLNGYPYTVVGVLPKDTRAVFGYGVVPDVYLPLNRKLMPDLNESDAATVTLFGRMKDGMSVEQARAALATVGQNLEATYPPESKGWGKVQRVYALDDPSRLSELPLLPVFGAFGSRRRTRAADRLRQRRRPVARARHDALSRNRGALGAGRQPRRVCCNSF